MPEKQNNTAIEDLRIFKLDLKNEDAISHITKLKKDKLTVFWENGYPSWNSMWDSKACRAGRTAEVNTLKEEFARVDLTKLTIEKDGGLKHWLKRFGIKIYKGMKKAAMFDELRRFWAPARTRASGQPHSTIFYTRHKVLGCMEHVKCAPPPMLVIRTTPKNCVRHRMYTSLG